MDRFDLEEEIMHIWSTADDIETLYKSVSDHPEEWDTDRLANALLGLSVMHNAKSQIAFETFETLVGDGTIS